MLFLGTLILILQYPHFFFFFLGMVPTFFAALVAGLWIMMYIIFATFVVGFEALLYNHFGFLPTWLSESFPLFCFSIKFFFFFHQKKKKKKRKERKGPQKNQNDQKSSKEKSSQE
jgi:hypothetical protein